MVDEIRRQSGLEIVLIGRSDQVVSLAFEALPVDRALRRSMSGNGGGMLVYEDTPGGEPRLVGAYLALEGGGAGIRESHATAPAPVTQRAVEGGRRPRDKGEIPAPRTPQGLAAAEEHLRTGAIEDFLPAAVALFPE